MYCAREVGRTPTRETPQHRRTGTTGLCILALAAALACPTGGSARADTPGWAGQVQHEARDSGGIRIVENRRPESGSRLGWIVGTEPVVTIGTRDASEVFQLYRVGAATRLSDGRIVVANGGSNELLVFANDGSFLDSWAGRGEGPGEFESLALVRPWPGDSLVAGDSQQGRVSIFNLAGAHGRTMSLRGPADPITREMATAGPTRRTPGSEDSPADAGTVTVEPHIVIRALPDGTMLTRTPRGYIRGFHRWESTYALMDADGSTRVTLGNYLGADTYSAFYEQPDGNYAVIPLRHPFGRTTLTAAWGDLAAIGDSETYEIMAYRSDGSLARIVRRDHEARIPTQAEQDEAFRDRFAGLSEEDREPRMAVAADAPLVESFPAYSRLRGDALGYLWVAEFKLPDAEYEGTVWTVFDREGRALGFVETPGGLSILEIGEDYILGETVDELGVEYVQVWELARPG